MTSQEYLSAAELEMRTGVRESTWRLWIRQGKIPHVKLGKRLLISLQDFQQFMQEHHHPAEAQTVE